MRRAAILIALTLVSSAKGALRGRFFSATAATGYAEEQSLGGYCVGGSTWRPRRR